MTMQADRNDFEVVACGRRGFLCHACREDRADQRIALQGLVVSNAVQIREEFQGQLPQAAVALAVALRRAREGGAE